jgi:phenylpropionate dioxygenase-like ring-hydroxylating dioxygenase large terminal subunit
MAEPRTPIDALLAKLGAQAALPAERAESLPPELYHRPDVYALERERIFASDWMCVGRVDQLPVPGDWLKIDLVDEPIVVIRDERGTLRALSRVCRHRAMDLLNEVDATRGSATRLECPYHLWSYGLDGRLQGAPEMRGASDFDRAACRLPEYRLEVWQGFIFVCLDPTVAPLAERMAPLVPFLGGIDMSDWEIAGTVPWGEVAVNWKIAIENGAECYHHIGTHRGTLQPFWPARSVVIDETSGRELIVARMRVSPDAAVGEEAGFPIQPIFLPPIPGLTPEQRSQTLVIAVFPMFFLALGPDSVTWFDWLPTGPESHTLDIRVVVPPGSRKADGFDAALSGFLETVHAIQAEDARTNAGVQRGAHARAATTGRLSPLERALWQFQRYLAHRLTGADV